MDLRRAPLRRALPGYPPGAGLVLALAVAAGHAFSVVRAHAQTLTLPPSIIAQDRLDEAWWAARHKAVLASAADHADAQLVFLGDSIIQNFEKALPPDENFQPTWKWFYQSRSPLNLGFSGDTTANVLWRLRHGEIDGLQPRAIVLLIGTNNTAALDQSAEETVAGIRAVVNDLEVRLPQARILLLGILPSGICESKTVRDQKVNALLATRFAGDVRVLYLDIGAIFYNDNGSLNTQVFYDPRLPPHGPPLHPDTVGQRMMAEAIEPALAHLMGDHPHRNAPPPELSAVH